jgi:hypothetical protein
MVAALVEVAVLLLANVFGFGSAVASLKTQRRSRGVFIASSSSLLTGLLLVAWASMTDRLVGFFAVLCAAPLAWGAFGLLRFGCLQK